MDEEEARAQAYRNSLRAQYAYRQAQMRSLAGDPAALAALTADWEPLIAAIREASHGPEPAEPKYNPKDTDRPGYLGGWKRL